MAGKNLMETLRSEFSFLKEENVLAVLLFGSLAKGELARDTDICIVAPGVGSNKIMGEVYQNVNVASKKYDVYCFEELPLYMKWEVIHNHKVIWAKDEPELGMYFYYYRKLYDDQKHRFELSREEVMELFHTAQLRRRKEVMVKK